MVISLNLNCLNFNCPDLKYLRVKHCNAIRRNASISCTLFNVVPEQVEVHFSQQTVCWSLSALSMFWNPVGVCEICSRAQAWERFHFLNLLAYANFLLGLYFQPKMVTLQKNCLVFKFKQYFPAIFQLFQWKAKIEM